MKKIVYFDVTEKVITGEIIEDTEFLIKVKTRDGFITEIGKRAIVVMREVQ